MLKKIEDSIDQAIEEAIKYIADRNPIAFTLLLGRADSISGLQKLVGTDCVIDYELDRYNDETRYAFYLKYLNKNYCYGLYSYEGKDGIYDLNIKMMIYSHAWESSSFFKNIYRIATIVKDGEYKWDVNIPNKGIYKVIKDDIVTPLKNNGLKLGGLIEESYSSVLRNAFAHSLYQIDEMKKEIYTRSNNQRNTYTFENFQLKFLKSIILCNHLENYLNHLHDNLASSNAVLTDTFTTPDGINVFVYGSMEQKGDCIFPEFRLIKAT